MEPGHAPTAPTAPDGESDLAPAATVYVCVIDAGSGDRERPAHPAAGGGSGACHPGLHAGMQVGQAATRELASHACMQVGRPTARRELRMYAGD